MLNFYPGNTNHPSPFGTPVSPDDIDLREELSNILWKEARGSYFLYRKIQLEDNQPKRCICWDSLTQEPDIDTQCRICKGLGYYFNDHMVRGYKSNSQGFSSTRRHHDEGLKQTYYRTFYFEHNFVSLITGNNFDIPTTYDKIIEVESDIDGVISSPLRVYSKYDIISIDSYRLESGRIEYYRIRALANLEESYLV